MARSLLKPRAGRWRERATIWQCDLIHEIDQPRRFSVPDVASCILLHGFAFSTGAFLTAATKLLCTSSVIFPAPNRRCKAFAAIRSLLQLGVGSDNATPANRAKPKVKLRQL